MWWLKSVELDVVWWNWLAVDGIRLRLDGIRWILVELDRCLLHFDGSIPWNLMELVIIWRNVKEFDQMWRKNARKYSCEIATVDNLGEGS